MCGKLGEPLLAVESGVLRIEQKVGGMIDVHSTASNLRAGTAGSKPASDAASAKKLP